MSKLLHRGEQSDNNSPAINSPYSRLFFIGSRLMLVLLLRSCVARILDPSLPIQTWTKAMSKIIKRIMRRICFGSASSPPLSNTPPGTIAGPSESPPCAIHESEWSPLTVRNKSGGRPVVKRIVVAVFNASGATDGPGLVRVCPLRPNTRARPTDRAYYVTRPTDRAYYVAS